MKNEQVKKQKKRFGDRPDGTFIWNMDSLHKLMPHLYNKRADSEVHFAQDFDITRLLAYLEDQNAQHPEYKTTVFHAILTAFGKIVYHRPILNRFIMGRRFYQRNDIVFGFVLKLQLTETAEERMMKFKIRPDMTLNSISNYLVNGIKERRGNPSSSTDTAMDIVTSLPRFLTRLIVRVMKILDFYGLYPEALAVSDASYSTAFFTNLGSIKCPPVFHHLSDWGTCSIFTAVGTIQKKTVFSAEGVMSIRDMAPISIVLDERIGDGFYFARSLKLIQYLFDNPELLNTPIEETLPE